MNEKDVLDVLGRLNAVLTGHFVFTSWKHGSAYINKDAIYPHTRETSRLCAEMAKAFAGDNVEVVIAPAVGGVILSQWVAYHLSNMTGRDVLGVYAEKQMDSFRHPDSIGVLDLPIKMAYEETGRFVIKRGYDKLITGKNILVVEDLFNTGGSVQKVVKATRDIGGNVVGVGGLCNRGGVTAEDIGGVPKLIALANVKMDIWPAEDCPLCAQGVPINTDVGHGRDFIAQKKQTA